MAERTFFRGHSASKILEYDGKANKTWSISTVLIIIKTEGFRSSEKLRLSLLNWSFGFQSKISFVFSKSLYYLS